MVNVQKTELATFAVDTKCFSIAKDPNDVNQFQNDINSILSWSTQWYLDFNIEKCERLVITRKKDISQYSYTLENHTISCTGNQTDLGVIVSKDLKRKDHTARVVGKAYRMLGFIKRCSVR